MKESAVVTSVHRNSAEKKMRINLHWEGTHEVSDFALEKLGELVGSETETEHSGWAEVTEPNDTSTGDSVPLR